jgi:hypothetical protein
MDMLAKMADDKDYQVWVERVGEGGPSAIIMEDGLVKSQPRQEAPKEQEEEPTEII